MSINKTLTLSWEGVDFDVNITMRLIDKIEEDINLMKMVERMSSGDVRFSHAAKLVSHLLHSAGCTATQEDVFQGMFGDSDIQPNDLLELLWKIFAIIFPEPKKKSKVKPNTSKRTRGKASTK